MELTDLTNLFDAHASALTLYARGWLGDDAAHDVVQDVFVRLASARRPQNPKAWLFCAVRNAAISHLRSAQRRQNREQLVAQGRPGWFEPAPGAALDAAAAQQALAALAATPREIVTLRLWGGLSFAEIATLTGAPLSSVYDQYHAGISRIRQTMEASCPTTNR